MWIRGNLLDVHAVACGCRTLLRPQRPRVSNCNSGYPFPLLCLEARLPARRSREQERCERKCKRRHPNAEGFLSSTDREALYPTHVGRVATALSAGGLLRQLPILLLLPLSCNCHELRSSNTHFESGKISYFLRSDFNL